MLVRGSTAATSRWRCAYISLVVTPRCAEAYEAKGIPARRIGSLKASAKLAQDEDEECKDVLKDPAALHLSNCSFEELKDLEAQDTASLKAECQSLGLPVQHLRQQDTAALRDMICHMED